MRRLVVVAEDVGDGRKHRMRDCRKRERRSVGVDGRVHGARRRLMIPALGEKRRSRGEKMRRLEVIEYGMASMETAKTTRGNKDEELEAVEMLGNKGSRRILIDHEYIPF
jgi:hypothetical protein